MSHFYSDNTEMNSIQVWLHGHLSKNLRADANVVFLLWFWCEYYWKNSLPSQLGYIHACPEDNRSGRESWKHKCLCTK